MASKKSGGKAGGRKTAKKTTIDTYNPHLGEPDIKPKGWLRSHEWFKREDRDGFSRRSWMKNQGRAAHLFDGRPVIGICNTWSEFNPCNSHFRILADYVKRGVYEMG
ncbi:MAG: dihydroxy-acid dehydratase, partial [Burkholderiales bacterium]|nr:dihydroxy-acid dehydratase [Burkholderiales bacterium]